MKVTRATEKEIETVNDFLNELASLDRYFGHEYALRSIKDNKEDFPVLSKFDLEDSETLLDSICQYVNNIRYEVVMFNLKVLMDNCVDLKSDTLEFNEDITKGLELLEEFNPTKKE